jgi:hypothetical protein
VNKKRMLMLVAAFSLIGCNERYTDVLVASSASISQQWSELRPEKPLQWTRPEEEFSFHIDTPHQQGEKLDIVGPSGEHCLPDVELVTTSGKTISLDGHGFWGEDMYFYLTKGKPGNEAFQAIRIRCSMPLRISNLIWRGYDPTEVKR